MEQYYIQATSTQGAKEKIKRVIDKEARNGKLLIIKNIMNVGDHTYRCELEETNKKQGYLIALRKHFYS